MGGSRYPGWIVADTEPTNPFEGMGWFDTNVDQLKIHDGTDFSPLAGGLSPDDLHNLALLQGLIDKTADLELRSEREWIAATDAALLVTSGRPTGPSLPNETYVHDVHLHLYQHRRAVLGAADPARCEYQPLPAYSSPKPTVLHPRLGRQPLLAPLHAVALQILWAELYQSNAVGDVLTIEKVGLEKETTAYIGNVEGAYPVPDIEKLTDDLQVRSEAPTWSAGANHVDIGTFQGVPDLTTLEQHVYADQLDFVLASQLRTSPSSESVTRTQSRRK